jgi:hypothetical protein
MSLILPYDNNLNDGGFYQVGDAKFLVKAEALLYATKTKQSVYWNWHDELLDKFDWSVEPSEGLDQLYRERAEDLRSRYDHIVLHYTGGYDCNNILETFIRNNIKIDELLIRMHRIDDWSELDGLKASNMGAESKHTAYPLAKWVKDTYFPNLIINVVDPFEVTMSWLSENKHYAEDKPWILDPTQLMRSNFDMIDNRYVYMAEKGIRIVHITGHDKPVVDCDDAGNVCSYVVDTPFSRGYMTPRITMQHLPYYFEFFYWHKNCAKMLIKQSHIIMRHNLHVTEFKYVDLNGREQREYEDNRSCVLYRNGLPRPRPGEKSINHTVIPGEHIWWFKYSDTKEFHNWKRNQAKIHFLIGKQFHNRENFFEHGLHRCKSKRRIIRAPLENSVLA